MREYSSMNLKAWKEVVRAQRPSRRRVRTQEMFYVLLVKGAAMDASASLNEIPTSAAFNAPQSLAPSPHMPTLSFKHSLNNSTNNALSSGPILA